jgi:hypothetical protein
MSDKWLAAAFYLPSGDRKADLPDFVRVAGAVTLPPLSPDSRRGGVDVAWAGLAGWAYLDTLPSHHVLTIFFRQSQFLDLIDVEPSRHPLALAFRQACVALHPDVAFVVTHLDQAERDNVLSYEWLVIDRDADALLRQHFGLLYLDRAVADRSTVTIDGRDTMPVDGGFLVFSASRERRWF